LERRFIDDLINPTSWFLLHPANELFVVGCGQQQETNKLINEINAGRVKSQTLAKQAEAKRAEAKKNFDNGERSEGEKLIGEAANLYGQISELLNHSADNAEQIVKLNNFDWYKDYFRLHSKLIRNLAKLASGAREELLVRKNGAPSEAQLKSWEENIRKPSISNISAKLFDMLERHTAITKGPVK
jgi:hypothetical protein